MQLKMEHQKLINLLGNATTQPSDFREKNWVEIIDDACGTHNTNSQIKFKNTKLKPPLCDYSDSYILVKGTITITRAWTNAAARQVDETNKTIFKDFTPFTNYLSEINSTQVDNAKDLDLVMSMYNLIEYSDHYLKTSRSLFQYYWDEPTSNNMLTLLTLYNTAGSFKSKAKKAGSTPVEDNTKDVEIAVPMKYLSNFWGTIEMPLINREINLILSWSANCVI